MSGQYGLTKEEEDQIKSILDKHNIDYTDNDISIHVSEYNEETEKADVNIYVQVN